MKISRHSFIYRLYRIYCDNNVPASAAEMAYYLLFAFFPMLMVVYASLSLVGNSFSGMTAVSSPFLPESIRDLLDAFFRHLSTRTSNVSFLLTGIFLTLISVSRFTKAVKTKVRLIYCSKTYSSPIAEWIVSFIFTVLLLIIFYVTLFVMILGEHVVNYISQYFVINSIVQNIILILRYFITGFVVLTILTLFYYIIPNVAHTLSDVMWGTVFTLVSWIVISFIFTYYINNFAHYSLVYGSLGAFIILLLWFYMTSMLMLVGSIINSIIYRNKRSAKLQLETKRLP